MGQILLVDDDELLPKYIAVSRITLPFSARSASYLHCLGQSDGRVVDQHMPDDMCQQLVRLTLAVQNRSVVNEYMVSVPGRIAGAFFRLARHHY